MQALFGDDTSLTDSQQIDFKSKLTEFRESLRSASNLQADLFESALEIRHSVNGMQPSTLQHSSIIHTSRD